MFLSGGSNRSAWNREILQIRMWGRGHYERTEGNLWSPVDEWPISPCWVTTEWHLRWCTRPAEKAEAWKVVNGGSKKISTDRGGCRKWQSWQIVPNRNLCKEKARRVIATMVIFDNKIKASKVTNDSHEHCWERFHCARKSTKRRRNSLLDNERKLDFILMEIFLFQGDREHRVWVELKLLFRTELSTFLRQWKFEWMDCLVIKHICPKCVYTENLPKPVLIRTTKLLKWILRFMFFCSKLVTP